MAEAFKNLFNRQFFEDFTGIVERFVPEFDKDQFIADIFDEAWEARELKARARHTTRTLGTHLGDDYKKNVNVILEIIDYLQKSKSHKPGIESMFFPDFIEVYGLQDYDLSMKAMEKITQFFSCEFAVRPFIEKYPKKSLVQMQKWADHPHENVRRFASEGCRPRLPWGMALKALKKDPGPIIPILEKLKNDDSEFVRKSVANNLNDISKDNPVLVLDLIRKWKGKTKNTDWILKHGSRTLLKEANPEALELFGYASAAKLKLSDIKILNPEIKLGDYLEFAFRIENRSTEELLVRIEYGVYYQKANGSLSKKVFKISESKFEQGAIKNVNRKQHFKQITTRKYHKGLHRLSIIINGRESDQKDFKLI